MKKSINAITLTEIFEASELNRDEKIGGNIPSIKKFKREGNMTYSFLSKVAIRHYLFNTLNRLYPDDWKEAPIISGDVIQFDLTRANILNNAELDAFGYMYTISGQSSLTRKGCVGITKAISLEPWEGDMQFNANHDLVRRSIGEANPNPVNKEEHVSYFKVSFTIDIEKLGCDEWYINSYEFKNNELELKLNSKKDPMIINGVTLKNEGSYIVNENNKVLGEIEIINLKDKIKKVVFKLDNKIKQRRIEEILSVIKNGLMYHVSGENDGIVPKFIIAAALKLPVPIFHTFVNTKFIDESILNNSYIMENDGKKDIFMYASKDLNYLLSENSNEFYSDWDEFLNGIGCGNNESTSD